MAGNENLITDTCFILAITAGSGNGTGIVIAKALIVRGRCDGTGAIDGTCSNL